MAGECSYILHLWSISFIDIYSSSFLFFIYLCSTMIPLELGSVSYLSLETPNFLGLDLRKHRSWAHYLDFSVVMGLKLLLFQSVS